MFDGAPVMSRLANLLVIFALATPAAALADDDAAHCYSRTEMREHVRAEHLADPVGVVRAAARAASSEALGAELCRAGDTVVYRIKLLDRNGHIIRTTVDAATGKLRR